MKSRRTEGKKWNEPVPCRRAACPIMNTTEESAHGRISLNAHLFWKSTPYFRD